MTIIWAFYTQDTIKSKASGKSETALFIDFTTIRARTPSASHYNTMLLYFRLHQENRYVVWCTIKLYPLNNLVDQIRQLFRFNITMQVSSCKILKQSCNQI